MKTRKQLHGFRKAPASRGMGPGVRQVLPSALEIVDPFVFLDHFGPVEKKPGSGGIPPHPHAGIATITYLFSGSNRHQDSLGNDKMVKAGDLAWMQAGRGIVHSEGMNEGRTVSETVEGLQFWISLPAKDKFAAPAFYFHPAEELPAIEWGAAKIKVLCGNLGDTSSPVSSLSPAFIFDIHLPAGKTLELPVPEGFSAAVYVINGSADTEGKMLERGMIAGYTESGEVLAIDAVSDVHLVAFGGKPLKEPVYAYASFVMSDEQQVRQVIRDYEQGKMGSI